MIVDCIVLIRTIVFVSSSRILNNSVLVVSGVLVSIVLVIRDI